MKHIRKTGIALNLIAAIALLVSFLSPYVNPEKILLPGILSLVYPYLLLVNVLFLLLWLSLRKKYLLISLVSLLLGWNLHGRFIQLPSAAAEGDAASVLHVMTYNMRWLRHVPPYETGRSAEKISNMVSQIKTEAPRLDVLCMQEGGHGKAIGEALGMPFVLKADKMSTWLMSRHRILSSGTLFTEENPRQGFAAWADIRAGKDTIRVFGLHLKSNKITTETEELMHDIRIRERATWIRVQDILSKYGKSTVTRGAQAELLRLEIERSPYPVIVLGDFNDTPFSYAYQRLQGGLKDSFMEAGKGIGTTYAGRLPSLRIDYILSSPAFRVLNHQTPEWDYSDHFPVLATLAVP